MFTLALVPDILRPTGSFNSRILGGLRMKGEANLSWSDLWPVVLNEKSWLGEYMGETQVPCLTTERTGVCSLQERGLDSRRAVEAAVAAFEEWHCSALFCLSPSPAVATAPQLFHAPISLQPPPLNSWSPVIGGCLLQGRLGLWLCGSWGESQARDRKMETDQEMENDERLKERETKIKAKRPQE